jgi:hypothetical protein
MLLILHCLCALPDATLASGDTTTVSSHSVDGTATVTPITRHFRELSIPESLYGHSDPIIVSGGVIPDTIIDKRNHAHALLEKVLSGQRFLETLEAFSEIELPVGVVKSGGALDYTILIDRIQFTKEGALMDVYVSMALPQTGSRIAFHGIIPLSATGGIAGNAKVFLLGDHAMKLNSTSLITLKGTDRSYVEFDCDGFLGIQLDAEIEFSTDLLVPENQRGEPSPERLKIAFSTYTQSLHDIVAHISVPPFQVKGLTGFGFHVTQAYLDWSDLSNPADMLFPPDYTSSVIRAGLPNLWQGIYLRELEVALPPAFARRNAARVGVGVQQMIIDEQGLTGSLYVENVIADGDMNGWAYTVDKLTLQLLTNQVAGLALEGLLSIPVVKDKDGNTTQFKYIAQRSATGDYLFSVHVEHALKLDLWIADMNLHQGSRVVVTERNNTFYPSAHLSGELTINFLGKGPKASFNSIRFQNMAIKSEAPYFEPGTFGFGREGKKSSISKYPVVIDNISFKSEDRKVGLAFDLIVNISGKPEDESFAGKGGLIVWGVQHAAPEENPDGKVIGLDPHSWSFDRIEMTSIRINIKKPKLIELAGEVRFFDDDVTYGDGFKGSLKGKIHTIHVEAEALFGKTETFRYWYADALVELKTGVPVVPGVLSAFGFGGGYYSKMKQGVSSGSVTLGRSPSGITYVPDENTIGIRAIVLIGTPRPEAMRGDVSLEVSLNRHGGMNSVTFTGNANFMSKASLGKAQIQALASAAVAGNLTEKLESLRRGQVYGSVRLHFDNVNDVFHGNLEIYVNVAGGIVRGVAEGNKAGWAVLHFEKNDWYVHIGTPDQPLGLEVARIFKSKSYFMLGKNLPASPPPPPQVSEILGDIDLDYMRDMNALESGMGIAFGLHFLVDTGDLRFLMFYGRFSAGTGLDFMLKDYGSEYHCAGSSGPMGINGWYANGQAYAFVMGKIGIKVNLRFYKGTYDILGIGAAAILQAKGPNPFWMKGTVGGYYKILGGLVKGKCRFEVTVGKECKPVGEENLLEDVKMIAQISPPNNSAAVDVFNTPQIAFNIPVGEVFEITDIGNRKHFFRAILDDFVVFNGSRQITGDLVWNTDSDVVIFDAADILPGEEKIKAKARLTFEERINGTWIKVKLDGRIVAETAETNFETGVAPDHIPEENILVSYPQADQVNFHPREYSRGFVQLKDGQPYLFKDDPEWIQKIRFSDGASAGYRQTELVYHPHERRIDFGLPEDLQTSTLYRLEIVNIPKQETVVDQNVQKIDTELNLDESAGNATLTTQAIEGNRNSFEEEILYSHAFRTSRYNTFMEKMRDIRLMEANRFTLGVGIFQLGAYLEGPERFDISEISMSPSDESFIRVEAILEGNKWYERYVHPLVYADYPLLGWMNVGRINPSELGIPPVRDVFMVNGSRTLLSKDNGVKILSPAFSNEYIAYNLGESVAKDFRDLQRQAVNFIVDFPSVIHPRLERLVTEPLPYIRYGPYKIQMTYHIPGIEKRTSSYEMEIFNPIRDSD